MFLVSVNAVLQMCPEKCKKDGAVCEEIQYEGTGKSDAVESSSHGDWRKVLEIRVSSSSMNVLSTNIQLNIRQ